MLIYNPTLCRTCSFFLCHLSGNYPLNNLRHSSYRCSFQFPSDVDISHVMLFRQSPASYLSYVRGGTSPKKRSRVRFGTTEDSTVLPTSTSPNIAAVNAPNSLIRDNASLCSSSMTKTIVNTYTDGSARLLPLPSLAGWGLVVSSLDSSHHDDPRLCERYGPVILDRNSPSFIGALILSNNTGELSAIGEGSRIQFNAFESPLHYSL